MTIKSKTVFIRVKASIQNIDSNKEPVGDKISQNAAFILIIEENENGQLVNTATEKDFIDEVEPEKPDDKEKVLIKLINEALTPEMKTFF